MGATGEHTQRVILKVGGQPEASMVDGTHNLRIPVDSGRGPVGWSGSLTRPGMARDAWLTVTDILASDLRFKNRDRSDYLAYLRQQGKGANNELWAAQKAFLDREYADTSATRSPLEPILTVDTDGVACEVMSADASTYARLFLQQQPVERDADGFTTPGHHETKSKPLGVSQGSAVHAEMALQRGTSTLGSTYLPISEDLVNILGTIRSYRPTSLSFVPAETATPRTIDVPYPWIRTFGQVQLASTMPAATFEIAPVDLYNVLQSLRARRAKTAPRALRYELVPNEVPRLVLEPWDQVVRGTGAPYAGRQPLVVRTWGRDRLMVLARILPYAERVQIRLVGPGMPAFYVVSLPGMTLSLALAGWTSGGWGGLFSLEASATPPPDNRLETQIYTCLQEGPHHLDALATQTEHSRTELRSVLRGALQRGTVVHDVAKQQYRLRQLFETPPKLEWLRYRNDNEAAAHRLLEEDGQVRLTKVHDLGAEGVRIEGEVEDRRAHRSYRTSFTIDREGQVVDASCTSPQFRRSGIKEGPSIPMIALRWLYTKQQAEAEKARTTSEGQALIRAETRTYIKRDAHSTVIYRMSLDERRITMQWGQQDNLRVQHMVFSSADEAKAEYFGRLARLDGKGFIDVTASEMA